MAEIHVERVNDHFEVRVSEPGSESTHRVTNDRPDLAEGHDSPEAFIEACFAFMLEREPKESILGTFDVSVISRYFPDFEDAIAR